MSNESFIQQLYSFYKVINHKVPLDIFYILILINAGAYLVVLCNPEIIFQIKNDNSCKVYLTS